LYAGTMTSAFGFIARKVSACARLNPKLAEHPARRDLLFEFLEFEGLIIPHEFPARIHLD
jgi:hypothetical protein